MPEGLFATCKFTEGDRVRVLTHSFAGQLATVVSAKPSRFSTGYRIGLKLDAPIAVRHHTLHYDERELELLERSTDGGEHA